MVFKTASKGENIMMRKLIFGVAAVLVILGLGLTPGTDAAERKDVLVIGMATSDIISLDPAKAFEFSGVGIINQLYDKLLDFPAGRFDKPELSLAESWKVSDDGIVWKFKLK
jgi:peptide/nickel transport system substrate-binding protein